MKPSRRSSPHTPEPNPMMSSQSQPSNQGFPPSRTDPSRERYPFCVVWTPIPVLSWLLPMVGHMGVCDSQGIIHDFAGPYYISEDSMLFGNPVKYWDLTPYLAQKRETALYGADPSIIVKDYDQALATTTDFFRQTQMYNFFTNNCHSFVAYVLEAAGIGRTWNMCKLTLYMMLFGRYVSIGRFLKAHLPCIVLWAILIFVVRLGEQKM